MYPFIGDCKIIIIIIIEPILSIDSIYDLFLMLKLQFSLMRLKKSTLCLFLKKVNINIKKYIWPYYDWKELNHG